MRVVPLVELKEDSVIFSIVQYKLKRALLEQLIANEQIVLSANSGENVVDSGVELNVGSSDKVLEMFE